MSIVERVDRFQQKHPASGFPLAVIYKYVDDQGGYLAALITYYAFLSFFPVLLLLSTILAFVLREYPEVQQDVLDSAISQFPLLGDDLNRPEGLQFNGLGFVVGVLVALYGGLGVGQALQHAMNTAWGIPRNERGNPVKQRLRSFLILGTAGLALLATTLLNAFSSGSGAFGFELGPWRSAAVFVLSVVINTGVFSLAIHIATARKLHRGEVLPGAIAIAVMWQLLQTFGATYVRAVQGSNATYGTFALVLGLLAFLYVAAVTVVVAVEVNVVRSAHLYPRALMTPFTDDVVLTAADERAYTGYAEAQRNKGFETVEVGFDGPEDDEDPSGHKHPTRNG